LLSNCASFKKQAIKALLEFFSIEVSAFPDEATTAVNDYARDGKRLPKRFM
jgi:hypothetical protein